MKTFKLKSLQILEPNEEDIIRHSVDLLDGLIINREDDQLRWTIEAYVNRKYSAFLRRLFDEKNEIIIRAKITTESNEPAIFITTITGVNDIGDNLNVLFLGRLVDHKTSKVETLLSTLVEEGYLGKSLLPAFKQRIM
ncbi:YwpF family protein [Oceanobacillus manasiensis]|uniref:YwpF family protein n=1 Tax=Oceanobacillus manasiensis TaxID=586413 RepID=UPI0005A719F8|nr:YwpF family protein [Oceanobacillus manasiensis]